LYTDNSILIGPDKNEIDAIIKDMQAAKLDIIEEGELKDFLAVSIERIPDGTIHLTQSHLIDQILDNLKLNNNKVMTKKYLHHCQNYCRDTLIQKHLMDHSIMDQ
jgi:uncharacterized membrane protein YheB (UPF0754 family)